MAATSTRLLWEANPILISVTELRATTFVTDLPRLRTRILSALEDFQRRAITNGIEPTRVAQATEVLCALIDHVVTSMPWGADAGWKSLGRSKSSSGRRPAERVLDVGRASVSDVGLSELVCIVLELGFDKRSRGADDAQIEQMLAQLMPLHAKQGSPDELRLAPTAPATRARRNTWTGWLPLWVSSLVIAALLAVLFFVLDRSLSATSDRLSARIASLHAPATAAQPAQPSDGPR